MQDNDIVPTETKWPGLPGAALNCTSLLIIGHRKSGKSTLSRDLSNKETVLIDCDIGQNCGMECCMTLQTSD